MSGTVRRITLLVLLTLVAASPTLLPSPASAAPSTSNPSLRLIRSSDSIKVERFGHGPVQLDLGVYVAAVDGAFELRVTRQNYEQEPQLVQVITHAGQTTIRPLRTALLAGWLGLDNFFIVTISDTDGDVVAKRKLDWCPNGSEYTRARITDDGPARPHFPDFCGSNPFMQGMVWGIERGWATDAFTFNFGAQVDVPDGRYRVHVAMGNRYQRLFDVRPNDAAVRLMMKVTTIEDCFPPDCGHIDDPAPSPRAHSPSVPTTRAPDRDLLPDLAALPAWRMSIQRHQGKDFLAFGATVWNRGPGQLIVEGFRQPGDDHMTAYQYFYRDGRPVGRAPAGKLIFHRGHGHNHWHFLQFASYSLLDADQHEIVRSRKQSFCLAPTDVIDLASPGAVFRPYQTGLATACGSERSLWIREVLPTGWGDTYFQSVAGQSFNITDLPNGPYFIEVRANPTGRLADRTDRNDVVLRKIFLHGTPGHRRVSVPLWHGIDTEVEFCFPFCEH